MKIELPESWQAVIGGELEKPYFAELKTFLEQERKSHDVFPPEEDVFNAFKLTPYDRVRVVILGQDPYHDNGQAHGLAFSVKPGVTPPPSLKNIYKEMQTDLGLPVPKHGDLTSWAANGVMLLNTVLTVRAHTPLSHRGKGWETFTDAVISALSAKETPIVFMLWGAPAQKKEKLIDTSRHVVVKSAHPSPLSARNGFFGSAPFSQVNAALEKAGKTPVNWGL